jgi:hypothetical protein
MCIRKRAEPSQESLHVYQQCCTFRTLGCFGIEYRAQISEAI